MAEKKMTAAQKKAAEEAAAQAEAERKQTERKRLIGAGAVIAALALFAGGYAVGNSQDDDDLIRSSVIFGDDQYKGFPDFDFPRGPGGDDRGPRGDDDRRGPRGGDRFPGSGDFGFDFPEGFDFPFPEGFEFSPGEGFGEGFPGDGFSFGLECNENGECTFHLPEGFEFPGGPFTDESFGDDQPEAVVEPGFLGVSVNESGGGVVVAAIDPGSPADDVGIESGDVFVSVDGADISSIDDLVDAIFDAGAGTQVSITMDRDGAQVSFDVVLASPPT